MPRNGSGTMVILNTFVPNTDILSSEVNDNFDDIADEISNSLPRDGQAGMTGVLKLINGDATNPSLTFSNDPDTGFYLVGPNQIGISQGGVGVALLDLLFPAGIVKDCASDVAPAGHLLCYGQAISRTAYPKLYAAIGTKYGAGDGSTTFNVPDHRGRVSAGLDNMGGSAAGRLTNTIMTPDGNTLGAVGGSQTFQLLLAHLAAHSHQVNDFGHSHGVNDPGHSHLVNRSAGGGGPTFALFGGQFAVADVFVVGATTGITINGASSNISIQNNGGDQPHGNTQPTILFNKIISTGALS